MLGFGSEGLRSGTLLIDGNPVDRRGSSRAANTITENHFQWVAYRFQGRSMIAGVLGTCSRIFLFGYFRDLLSGGTHARARARTIHRMSSATFALSSVTVFFLDTSTLTRV